MYCRFQEAKLSLRSSALAYHTLLSIVPALGLCFWYLSKTPVTEKTFLMTKTFIMQHLTPVASGVFLQSFDKLTHQIQGNSWGWIGLVLFIYTVWNLISKFGESLDAILVTVDSEKVQPTFTLLKTFLRRLFVMLSLPLSLTISLLFAQWVKKDSWFQYLLNIKSIGVYFGLPLAWISSIVSLFLVYYFIPRRGVKWKEALKAALVIAPLSELLKYGFGLYNVYAVSVHKIYGVLAIIPLFILWIQMSWLLILSGAFMIKQKKH